MRTRFPAGSRTAASRAPHGWLAGSSRTSTPGAPTTDQKTYLRFATADGFIRATELQLEGKKKMNVEDFLRGYKPPQH